MACCPCLDDPGVVVTGSGGGGSLVGTWPSREHGSLRNVGAGPSALAGLLDQRAAIAAQVEKALDPTLLPYS